MKIVPFADEHLDAAAEMLAARHARHREAEPLLPADVDFRAQVETEWSADGASGVISPHGLSLRPSRRARAHGRDRRPRGHRRCRARARPLRRGGRGMGRGRAPLAHGLRPVERRSAHRRMVPAELRRLGRARDARDRRRRPYDGDVAIRPGTPDDFGSAARLELAMFESMQPSPSFSTLQLQTPEEVEAEWREDDFSPYELFVAERDGEHRRPPPPLPAAARPSRPRGRDRPRPGLDVSRGARHRRRPRAHRARDPLGPRARPPDDDHGLADDEPLGVALLAAPRFPDDLPPAQPRDPLGATSAS